MNTTQYAAQALINATSFFIEKYQNALSILNATTKDYEENQQFYLVTDIATTIIATVSVTLGVYLRNRPNLSSFFLGVSALSLAGSLYSQYQFLLSNTQPT